MTNAEIIVERKQYGSSAAMDYTMRVYQKLDEETIMIDGVKYQKVEEQKPQTLLKIIREWNDNEDYPTCEELVDMIAKWLPDEDESDDMYSRGWNECLNQIKGMLR